MAALAFEHLQPLAGTPSGRELIERGFAQDVELAGELDASDVVPVLRQGSFTPRPSTTRSRSSAQRESKGSTRRRSRPASSCRSPASSSAEQVVLAGQQPGERVVHGGPSGRGEPDDDAAPVARVGQPLHEPARGQPVHPVGHGAAGDQGLGDQLAGGQLVRRAGPAQRRQHVELPALQVVLGEGGAAGAVQVPGQPGDPGQHLERLDVQVRALALPGEHDAVDLVAGPGGAHAASS